LARGRTKLTPQELQREIADISWFHRIDLGHGIVTPGCDNSPEKLQYFGIPADLRGWSVLDIGAWDGFFSFEAERRGARYVLATDHFCWDGGGWGRKTGFELARQALNSRVHDKRIGVMDLLPETVGVFDLVLFLGVLYHMRHPLLALEKVARVTGTQLVLETHVDLLDCPRPAMAFYPGRELNSDPTNWCGPNPPMVEAMLRDVGFKKVVVHAGPIGANSGSPRMVFHAWK
jgi:tRNA (mo5U34)-methyltransferase